MATTKDRRISRRALIGGAATAAGAAALPQAAAAAQTSKSGSASLSADVIVVGAGLSGLTAARQVHAAGRSAIVLEARDRVGGRTLNHDLAPTHPGKVVEIGGQWIGPTQDHLAKLARELGVKTFKTYNNGNYLFYESGKLTPYSPKGPLGPIPPDLTADAQIQPLLSKLDSMAKTVPLGAPWTAPNADDWDGQTFETFKRAQGFGSGANSLLDLTIEAVFACEPRDISLLHVLFYIHSAGNERTPHWQLLHPGLHLFETCDRWQVSKAIVGIRTPAKGVTTHVRSGYHPGTRPPSSTSPRRNKHDPRDSWMELKGRARAPASGRRHAKAPAPPELQLQIPERFSTVLHRGLRSIRPAAGSAMGTQRQNST